jgi:hypothetical protein
VRPAFVVSLLGVVIVALGCGGTSESGGELFPDVVAAEVKAQADGTYQVSATLRSPYDSPDRYADAWRVITPDGVVLGIRELAHDHAGEQPFTRSLGGVEIPMGITEVVVEGRDQVSGWGGGAATAAVPALPQ